MANYRRFRLLLNEEDPKSAYVLEKIETLTGFDRNEIVRIALYNYYKGVEKKDAFQEEVRRMFFTIMDKLKDLEYRINKMRTGYDILNVTEEDIEEFFRMRHGEE